MVKYKPTLDIASNNNRLLLNLIFSKCHNKDYDTYYNFEVD